jgi:hypothetical protein
MYFMVLVSAMVVMQRYYVLVVVVKLGR